MKNNIKWLIMVICIFLFLLLSFYITSNNPNIIDTKIYNLIISLKSDKVTKIFKIISSFAGIKFMILMVIIILLLNNLKKIKYIMLLNILNDLILNNTLKLIFKRPRPQEIMLVLEKGYSYPSGHTMLACIFYGFIIYLINKSNYNKKIKIIVTSILTLLILLIGISRIYLGVHYATDVIASYLVSIIYLIIFTHLIKIIIKN